MRRIVVLGGGTAGTMVVNKLRRRLTRASGRSPSSTATTTTSTSRGTCSCRSARYTPRPGGQDAARVHPRRRGAASWARSTGWTPTTTACCSPTAACWPTTIWSSRPARPRGPTRRPGMLGRAVAPEHLRLLHLRRRRRRCADALRRLRRRPAGRAHHRDADQVPGRAAGVHLPRRRVAARARASATGSSSSTSRRCRARSPSRSPPRSWAACWTTARSRRDRLHGRARRQRAEDAGLLRRARGAVRPAGHRPAEHGRRLRRPLRARRRAELRAGGQAHPAVHEARQHLRPRRRHRHPHVEGRLGRALLGRDLRRQLPRARSTASR